MRGTTGTAGRDSSSLQVSASVTSVFDTIKY